MKKVLVTATFLWLFFLPIQTVGAQDYVPDYYYAPYWDGNQYAYPYAQQYDPYYELHVMHYQLYLQPYQTYPYYCCAPIIGIPSTAPHVSVNPRPPGIGRRVR